MTSTETREDLRKAGDWLRSHDTGASSKAILARMLGSKGGTFDHPHDPSDFGRIAPWATTGRTRQMTLTEARECWDALEAYMEEECGHCPEYLNAAERSNLANMIFNYATPAKRWWQFWK
jgi:hypothetical protein